MDHVSGTCDYCGSHYLDDWYELTACLAAFGGEFPLPLTFASAPTFCSEACAVKDLADRGLIVRRPDFDELSARAERARGRWPIWLETFASLRTRPNVEGLCLSCQRQLPQRAYEVLAFHQFTKHDIPELLELGEPLRFCGEECAHVELERRGLGVKEA